MCVRNLSVSARTRAGSLVVLAVILQGLGVLNLSLPEFAVVVMAATTSVRLTIRS